MRITAKFTPLFADKQHCEEIKWQAAIYKLPPRVTQNFKSLKNPNSQETPWHRFPLIQRLNQRKSLHQTPCYHHVLISKDYYLQYHIMYGTNQDKGEGLASRSDGKMTHPVVRPTGSLIKRCHKCLVTSRTLCCVSHICNVDPFVTEVTGVTYSL